MEQELIPTRASLLSRLRDLDNQAVWYEFYDTYAHLIRGLALRSNLTSAEAEDVVQETIIGLARDLPSFRYNPVNGSFKSWLFQRVRWRCQDELRKRLPDELRSRPDSRHPDALEPETNPTPEPDHELDFWWEHGWETAVAQDAIQQAKRRVEPKNYQIFDLYVFKAWPAAKIARTLRVSIFRVYLAKHRVAKVLKEEFQSLARRYGTRGDRPLRDFPEQLLQHHNLSSL